ncbi:PQQ-binding-like beta-propeller repeat protein [Streptosporangium sp. NPDC000095]|uniref:outer membrane protein assembly factor BamB family protein n=1 Tax=Streptosporangium sp. NPDC000095 TaxID=3366184 RepID=UPI00369141A8
MPLRPRSLRAVLLPLIPLATLLVVPAAAPAPRPLSTGSSPITGIYISGDEGVVTAKISNTDRVIWKSAQAGDLLDEASSSMNEPETPHEASDDISDGGRDASTGRYLAVETQIESGNPNHPHDQRRRITVIDALTGLPTWSILSGYPGDGRARPFFYLMGAAAGKIIIDVPALRAIRALDPLHGTVVWETELPDDCMSAALPSVDPQAGEDDPVLTSSLADKNLAVAMTRCANRHISLTGIDPVTGRVRWERRFPLSVLPELILKEGVSVLTSRNALTVIDKNGALLVDDLVYHSPSWVITAGTVTVSDGGWGDVGMGVRSISRSSGRIKWSRPDLGGEVGRAAGKIYVRSWDTLTVLDPADGHTLVTLSEPLTVKDIKAALAAPPGWGDRGGVPAADWPDPCALLPAAELASRSGTGGYAVTPLPAPAKLGLTTPVACEFATEEEGVVVTVSVIWVYPSVKKAAEKMKQMTGGEDSPAAARRISYFNDAEDMVVVREGRVVVKVEAFGDRALLRHALRITREHLREGNP